MLFGNGDVLSARKFIRKLILKELPSCQTSTRLVSGLLDGRQSLPRRLLLRLHLRFCQTCARFERQLLLLRTVIHQKTESIENGAAASSAAHASLDPQARARLKHALARKQR